VGEAGVGVGGVGTVSVTTWPYAGVDILACHARRTVAGGW
jgi:hypothetical protein